MDGVLLLNVPCSQEFSGVLRFWACLLPLDFSFILPVVSRLLQLYSTDNKTSRLMVKRLPHEGHPERFTELHEEEEREEGDGDEQKEKKGDSRGERQIYTVVCSQCSP